MAESFAQQGTITPVANDEVDWRALAHVLADDADHPMVLLDKSGRVRLLNAAMERTVGWRRQDAVGKHWERVFVPVEHSTGAWTWIDEALQGGLRTHETTALTRSGGKVMFGLDVSLVGSGAGQALLVIARRVIPVPALAPPVRNRDLSYEVSSAVKQFGRMVRLHVDGEMVPMRPEGAMCFDMLYGLTAPCADCPIKNAAGAGDWPKTIVRQRGNDGTDGCFEIVTAEALNDTAVRVKVRVVSDTVLTAIKEVKLQQIAERFALTSREREVMRYLVMGRGVRDIATILEISERTVKYHQANLIEKVGADSRADLARLLF